MFHPVKVDLLGGEAEQKSRKATVLFAVIFAVTVGILSAVGAGASYRAALHGTSVLSEVGNLPIISNIRRLALGDQKEADPTKDGTLTFLIMGIGGDGHDGSQLADTILLATIDLNEQKIGLLSVPRDLAYPLGGGRFIKINAVNAYAEEANPGQGARETADAFEELFGITIDHVVKINFQAFSDLIDAVGGVDVAVEKSFVDYEYPTEDDKWQTVSFKAGEEHMDGARALIYSRSRHGSNGEGSDFARAHRQQVVILALKEKLLSAGTFTNPSKLLKIYEAISSNTQTDLTSWSILKLAPLAKSFSNEKVTMHVLTNNTNGELVSNIVSGAYMLFPKKPDWSEIKNIAQHPFDSKEDLQASQEKSATPTSFTIEVRNGTTVTGLASQMSDKLENAGYRISGIGNASRRDYEKTVIYDLTQGKETDGLAYLKNLLNANIAPSIPEGWTKSNSTTTTEEPKPSDPNQTQFLIILGTGSRDLIQK